MLVSSGEDSNLDLPYQIRHQPEVYDCLEEQGAGYAIMLSANAVLEREIRHLLVRPVVISPRKPVVRYHDFLYRAASWEQWRRVVAKVERIDRLLLAVG